MQNNQIEQNDINPSPRGIASGILEAFAISQDTTTYTKEIYIDFLESSPRIEQAPGAPDRLRLPPIWFICGAGYRRSEGASKILIMSRVAGCRKTLAINTDKHGQTQKKERNNRE